MSAKNSQMSTLSDLEKDTARKPGSANNLQILLSDLKRCTRMRNLERGRQVHAKSIDSGHASSIHVANSLIKMYAKCGSMEEARHVFDSVKQPTVLSWNMLILGYADNGQGFTALEFFTRMKNTDSQPNSVTFLAALKACISVLSRGHGGRVECLGLGKDIHHCATRNGCGSNIYVQNTLIDMYAKCGSMVDAREVFASMKNPDLLCWTVLILGYANDGQGFEGLDLFEKMRYRDIAPDSVTFVATIKACTSLALKGRASECRDRGKAVHCIAVENGYDSEVYVQTTLIDMYSKCGSMLEARQVFDSMKNQTVISWSVLILGYTDNGQCFTALDCFMRMRSEGQTPNSITFVAVLKACTSLGAEYKQWGKLLYNLAVDCYCDKNIYVQSMLIDMYAKWKLMESALHVFESIVNPNVVCWTALIMGYAENGQGVIALDLFTRMKIEGPTPNTVTFAAALKACGLVGGLEFGRKIHSEISNDLDVHLLNCLVDFYAKCGSILEAQRVFYLHVENRDIVTWTALLAGFSNIGDHESVFRLFEQMQDAGFEPDSVTFVSILTCCSHAGLVKKGKECFDTMSSKFEIVPTIEHYNCMLDIFGRGNKFECAVAMLECMPLSPDDVSWITILSACRKWKNVEMGRLAFQSLMSLNEENVMYGYVLMGQIYGSRGMLQEQEMVMRMRRNLRISRRLN